MASNCTASWRSYKRGAFFANPCFTQIHPTCIPVHGENQSKLTLMSESLRNDGRVWVPKAKGDGRTPQEIPEEQRDYYLERIYPSFGNLVPRDVASRQAKFCTDEGRGVGETGLAVYLDFKDAIKRDGIQIVREKYGNLFDMYQRITDEDPYQTPMRIYPAAHYTMGGLWVDYNLQSTVPGLFVLGEANFSDHGANRLGASALMQGLADGYFIIPYTLGNYLAGQSDLGAGSRLSENNPAFQDAQQSAQQIGNKLLGAKGSRSVDYYHRKLGLLMWEHVGMARKASGLQKAIEEIQHLRVEFWDNVRVTGEQDNINVELEKACRVADFMELGELMARDALEREESCGGHFREEFQTLESEARRDDERFSHVAAWEFQGEGKKPFRHRESLVFEHCPPTQRSYK